MFPETDTKTVLYFTSNFLFERFFFATKSISSQSVKIALVLKLLYRLQKLTRTQNTSKPIGRCQTSSGPTFHALVDGVVIRVAPGLGFPRLGQQQCVGLQKKVRLGLN